MCHQSPKHYIEIWHERPFSLHVRSSCGRSALEAGAAAAGAGHAEAVGEERRACDGRCAGGDGHERRRGIEREGGWGVRKIGFVMCGSNGCYLFARISNTGRWGRKNLPEDI